MRAKLLFLILVAIAAANAVAEERWYVFSIGETPVGYVSEESDGLRTRTVMFAKLVRLGSSIEMRLETTAVETAAGELQSLKYEQRMSKQPSGFEARVDGDRIRIGERSLERGALPVLGPIAIARRSAETLRAKGDAIEYAVLSPELQRVVRVRRTVLEAGDPVKIEESIEGLPAPRTAWIDARGFTVADTIAGPFGAMSTRRATREAALAANGELPADLYERTVARSNVRLADPSAVDRIVVRVTPRDGSQKMPRFETHNQRMVAADTVEIRRPVRRAGDAAYAKEHLESNAIVESKNAEVVKIAGSIDAPDAYRLAEALTQWVAKNLSMDAGIVMAPASELIRDRKATCMGYATLLAALARARGIPSRIAMGYVYYGGIWGGHAWTELWIDGQWLPFDAAVYAPGIASATRLAVGASSFADGGGELNGALLMLFGRADVKIVEYEEDGRVTKVPPDQQPYRIIGSRYVNPGLGIDVDASGWSIEQADSTWPSTLVVAFRRGNATIEVREKR